MSDLDSHLTIEEAATRLGVSVATARRMAADGRIPATKSGKQWIVDGSRFPEGRPRRRAPTRPAADVATALRHVRTTDLAEAWVPDVLRHADVLADEPAVLAAAASRLQGAPPGMASEVEIDKTVIFTRFGTLLDVADRVAYQAAVASFASRVDSQTPDEVFSARLSTNPRYFLKHGTKQWAAWRDYVRGQVERGDEWLVETDLTAYFDTIPHRLLVAEVESFNADPAVVAAINDMLRAWVLVPGYGLPQGGNASRFLANLYLLPVDRVMLASGWKYSRFLDDVRIAAPTKSDAIRAIRQFQKECRVRGLIVSSGKTRLLHGTEAIASLATDHDLAAASYLMDTNLSALARKELKMILRRALRDDARLDVRRARFSLWRLARLREGGVVRQVLNQLENLAPIASVVAAYLRPFIQRKSVINALAAYLNDPVRCQSSYMATWLFAAMLEHPGKLPASWASVAAQRVKDRNEPVYLRGVAALVLARGELAADVAWIKSECRREHDPAMLRAYAVALHWVHQLDKGTQGHLVQRVPTLSATLAFLKGRQALPSLVFSGTRLILRPPGAQA